MLNPACNDCTKVLPSLGDGDIEPLHQGQYANNEKKRMKKCKGGQTGMEAEASGHGHLWWEMAWVIVRGGG